MKLSDKAWKLGRNHGIIDGTVASFTRGDSTCEEFFTSESEAWQAEARRCAVEAERAERSAAEWRAREAQAAEKAKATA